MQVLFTNARIVDATGAAPREGHVLVEDGTIRDVTARPVAAPDRLVLDLRGRTLMPGLSMSTNSAVIPLCADSVVPVRVNSTHRCAYWAKLVHTFWPLMRQ